MCHRGFTLLALLLLTVFVATGCGREENGSFMTTTGFDQPGLSLPSYDEFGPRVDTAPDSPLLLAYDLWENQELVREIRDGNLVLALRRSGTDETPGTAKIVLATREGLAATVFGATMQVSDQEYVSSGSQVTMNLDYQPVADRAEGQKNWFSPRIRLLGGDSVDKELQLVADSESCLDADCTQPVPGGPFVLDGSGFPNGVRIGPKTNVKLDMGYSAENAEIVFTEAITNTTGMDVSTIDPSISLNLDTAFHRAVLSQELVSKSPDPALLKTLVSEVRVNGAVYDTFSGDRLDLSLWETGELVREIENEELRLVLGARENQANVLTIRNWGGMIALQADFRVVGNSYDGDGNLRAMMGGYWFNDGSPGDGAGVQNGDIYAEIGLDARQVFYSITRCVNATCTEKENVTGNPANPRVVLAQGRRNRIFTLFIGWDGESLTFQANNNLPMTFSTTRWAIPVVHSTAMFPVKYIGVVLDGATEGSGYLDARVDNVRAGFEEL